MARERRGTRGPGLKEGDDGQPQAMRGRFGGGGVITADIDHEGAILVAPDRAARRSGSGRGSNSSGSPASKGTTGEPGRCQIGRRIMVTHK